jgi:hypothetical protein
MRRFSSEDAGVRAKMLMAASSGYRVLPTPSQTLRPTRRIVTGAIRNTFLCARIHESVGT